MEKSNSNMMGTDVAPIEARIGAKLPLLIEKLAIHPSNLELNWRTPFFDLHQANAPAGLPTLRDAP